MAPLPDLPSTWQFVSEVHVAGNTLTIRFLPESLEPSDACAFVLRAQETQAPVSALAYLEAARERGDFLTLSWEDGGLCIESEFGEEAKVFSAVFTVALEAPAVVELRKELRASREEYDQEYERARELSMRLKRLREVLVEQIRRVEIKAAAHTAESAAGVLYSQQRQLFERLLRETEA